jgi:hypothetical protein
MQIAISKEDGTYILYFNGEIQGCITGTGLTTELIEEVERSVNDLKTCLCNKQIEEQELIKKYGDNSEQIEV